MFIQGTPEYVQFVSKEVLARLNWILPPQYLHSHNIFSKNLRKVILTPRREVVSSEGKHHNLDEWESAYLQKKTQKQDVNRLEEYSAFEVAHTPYCRPVYLDAEVQTDLTASEIEVSLMASSWAQTNPKVFGTLICNTDRKYFFNSGTFILTKLGSISLTKIVIKS